MRRRPWLAGVGLAAAVLLSGGTAASAAPSTTGAADTSIGGTGSAPGGGGAPAAPPDAGSAPQSGGTVVPPDIGSTPGSLPGSTLPGSNPGGPLGTRIALQTIKVQSLAAQAEQLQGQLDTDKSNVDAAKGNLDLARQEMRYFQGKAGHNGRRAYRSAAKIPQHLDPAAHEYRRLAKLAPWLAEPGTVDGSAAGASYQQAKKLYAAAQAAYRKAVKQQRDDKARYASLRTQLSQAIGDLKDLRAKNDDALDTQRQDSRQYLGSVGGAVDGLQANPKALAAVRFALRQLGKPYVWGAEGPDAYDCSGLVLDAYQHAGVFLPRVADQQYRATASRPVPLSTLLPGDLIFYGSTPGVSTSIYHVAMYIGHGKVVQAPTFGVPVQVATLSLGGFYGATRVVPAVRADGSSTAHPAPHPSPGPSSHSPGSPHSPSPSPSPSKSTEPGGNGSTSPKPSPSASGSGSPSGGSDGDSPSGTCSPSPSPSGSTSPSPSPSPSTSTSPSPSPSCTG